MQIRSRWSWLLLLALGTTALAATRIADDQAIIRVHTRDRVLIQRLGHDHDHIRVADEKGVVFLEANAAERADLRERGFQVEIDAAATAAFNAPMSAAKVGIPGYACYRTVDQTNARLDELATLYPGHVQIVDIGDSWEKVNLAAGEDLRVVKLGSSQVSGAKPKLLVSFGIHPREYPTVELGLRFAEWLATGYGVDADATWILDHNEVHLLVMTNPDGRKKAQTGLSWRKNTSQAYCGATSNSRGVDLNRNFGFMWNCCGTSSTAQCNETYHGPIAQSEPESAALDAYMKAIFADRRGPALTDAAPDDTSGIYIDIHNFADLVMWPWGFDDPPASGPNPGAPNVAALRTLGRRLAWFNGYTPQQINELYGADGSTADNAYGELGVASFAMELGSTGFFQDCSVFEHSIYPDNLQTLIYAAKVVRAPYLQPAGPTASAVTASPPLVFAGDSVRLQGNVSDARFNQSNGVEATQSIANAAAFLDLAPWQAGAVARPLGAVDGAFDSSEEAVALTLDSSALTPGRHMVYVQGQDSSGQAGAAAATFLQVVDPASHGTLQGTVRNLLGQPLDATVSANSIVTHTEAASGSYLLRLPASSYDLTVSAAGFESQQLSGIAIGAGQTTTRNVQLFALCEVLRQDAEAGLSGWTTQVTSGSNTWGIVNADAAFASRYWTESPAGNYANNINTSLVSPVLDLSGHTQLQLDFDSFCGTETGADFGRVETRLGSGSWTEVFRCDGEVALQHIQLALPQLDGAVAAQIRLRTTSDTSVTRNGWGVDNIVLRGGGAVCRAAQGGVDSLFDDGFE